MASRSSLFPKIAATLLTFAVVSWCGYSRVARTESASQRQSHAALTIPEQVTKVDELPASISSSDSGATAESDFERRCHSSGVIRCVAFDAPNEIAGSYGDNYGVMPGATVPTIDTGTKASGTGSLRFEIPAQSGANTSGSFFANFSANLSTQFGENSEFYVQWRQRFSPEFLSTYYKSGEGWKQAILGTGDQPGHPYPSCTTLEIVVQNTYQRGFVQMYNSCTGSQSHSSYDAFQERYGSYDFKLQNARPAPFCLYSQGRTEPVTFFPPKGGCLGYFANEWMTFQVGVRIGPRAKDEFTNSYVQLWVARERGPSQLVINWGPYNLSAGDAGEDQKYGKIWLLPYHTDKDPNQITPRAYVWYDELIISRARIPDPS